MRRHNLFPRAAVLAAALPAALAVTVATAGEALAYCRPHATAGVGGSIVSAGAYEPVHACVEVAGQGPTYIGINGFDMPTVTPTFECATWTGGELGDPSEPTTHVPYRVGISDGDGRTRFCVEVRGVAFTASRAVSGPLGVYYYAQPDQAGDGIGCSDDATPGQYVWVQTPEGYQSVWVGLACSGTAGPLVSCPELVDDTAWFQEYEECPAYYDANYLIATLPGEVQAAAEQAVADVEQAVAAAMAEAWARVGDAQAAVQPYLDEVVRVVTPIVDLAVGTALWAAGTAAGIVLGVVYSVAEVGSEPGPCTVNVASFGDVSVTRSPTGQVPTSVCVTSGTSVVRLTVG